MKFHASTEGPSVEPSNKKRQRFTTPPGKGDQGGRESPLTSTQGRFTSIKLLFDRFDFDSTPIEIDSTSIQLQSRSIQLQLQLLPLSHAEGSADYYYFLAFVLLLLTEEISQVKRMINDLSGGGYRPPRIDH